MLSIILTSYNRPLFVKRAIESILAQTSPLWRLVIQDDGSDAETVGIVMSYAQKNGRITASTRLVEPSERAAVTRYSMLINEVLPDVDTPLVGYMCDNVEYHPDMAANVISAFEQQPQMFAGYVLHRRDMWAVDGSKRLGDASDFGHWDQTPPYPGYYYGDAAGVLDHSQVFHRLPTACRWSEDIANVKKGDAVFFNQLIAHHGHIWPIRTDKVLSMEHLVA
jgi:spore maturation protein CgeD